MEAGLSVDHSMDQVQAMLTELRRAFLDMKNELVVLKKRMGALEEKSEARPFWTRFR
jgi:hypothetical protein